MEKIRVLVVDDHPLMLRALCEVVDDENDMEVVGTAINGQDALEKALALKPDLVVMDLLMPVMDGVQAIRIIREQNPQIRILAITSMIEEERVLAAVRAGASGYFSKDSQPEEILSGIRIVMQGGLYLPPIIADRFISGMQKTAVEPAEVPEKQISLQLLSAREQEILTLLGEGYSNRAIAQKLTVTEATIRSHISHILNKLGLEDRNKAVIFAANRKL